MSLFGISVLVFIFVVGVCIGSFLNVVILRALSGESIVMPPSKCPKCQEKLCWWHNIPILSFLFLRGKCAYCKEPIGVQYPIIELVTGIVFLLLFLKYGVTLDTLFAWIFAGLLIVIAGTDIKEKVVFDVHTYSLIAFGLLYSIVVTGILIYLQFHNLGHLELTKELAIHNPLTVSLLGIIAGVIIMEGLARLGYLVAGTRAFGEGDTLIAAGLGAIGGWKVLLATLILSLIIQIVLTLPLFFKKLLEKNENLTAILLACFIVYTTGFALLNHLGILSNTVVYTLSAAGLGLLGLFTCKQIIVGIKNKESDMMYLPFGPAMVAAALIMMIF